MTADREMVVSITLDSTALAAELDRVAAVLADAADRLRPPSAPSRTMTFEEMPEWERTLLVTPDGLVDRTGLCDHCDKQFTGGAAGGGQPPEHWCDDHRPADWPGSPDDEAPEPWEPKVGDRVQSQAPARLAGTGTVARVDDFGPYPVWVRLDSWSEQVALAAHELRPLADPQPATVGPERLLDSVRGVGCICGECRQQREMAVAHVQERFAQYPSDALASQVYAGWFGGAQ